MKLKNILNIRNWRAKYWFLSGKEDGKLDYNLNEDSLVFEIGAFTGNTTKQIWDKHHCNIHAFEPVKQFFKQVKKKVPYNPEKIKLHNLGLSNKTKKQTFFLKDIGSSIYVVKDKDYQEFKETQCDLKDISEFLDEKNINNIDLMIIDAEGSEYEILERLILTNKMKRINNLMIQFHKTIPNYKEKRKQIRRWLKVTHNNKYTLPFVWEKWERN